MCARGAIDAHLSPVHLIERLQQLSEISLLQLVQIHQEIGTIRGVPNTRNLREISAVSAAIAGRVCGYIRRGELRRAEERRGKERRVTGTARGNRTRTYTKELALPPKHTHDTNTPHSQKEMMLRNIQELSYKVEKVSRSTPDYMQVCHLTRSLTHSSLLTPQTLTHSLSFVLYFTLTELRFQKRP